MAITDDNISLQLLSANNYLIIEKMRDGGFTASHPAEYRNPSHAMFACTGVDELLAYIHRSWAPPQVQPIEPPKGFAPAQQPPMPCNYCHKMGHLSQDCPTRQSSAFNEPPPGKTF